MISYSCLFPVSYPSFLVSCSVVIIRGVPLVHPGIEQKALTLRMSLVGHDVRRLLRYAPELDARTVDLEVRMAKTRKNGVGKESKLGWVRDSWIDCTLITQTAPLPTSTLEHTFLVLAGDSRPFNIGSRRFPSSNRQSSYLHTIAGQRRKVAFSRRQQEAGNMAR